MKHTVRHFHRQTQQTQNTVNGQDLGKFLVLEGGEGSGKSTQLQFLASYLHARNIPYLLTREPGGTPLAEQLRSVIVGEDVDAVEEMLLILAARRHHIRTVIQPALESGLWVLCDRFVDSSLVYQGIVGGLDLDLIHHWHHSTECHLVPDHTFILHVDPAIAMARRLKNRLTCNKFDQKGMDFHQKIHQAYLLIAQHHAHRCTVIPAHGTLEDVTNILLNHVRTLFDLDASGRPD